MNCLNLTAENGVKLCSPGIYFSSSFIIIFLQNAQFNLTTTTTLPSHSFIMEIHTLG